jgi:hypothetical protein
MMKGKHTCCALTRLDPIILKPPRVPRVVGCPGSGKVVDWTYEIPNKREEMYSIDEKVPIGKGRERKERNGKRVGKGIIRMTLRLRDTDWLGRHIRSIRETSQGQCHQFRSDPSKRRSSC